MKPLIFSLASLGLAVSLSGCATEGKMIKSSKRDLPMNYDIGIKQKTQSFELTVYPGNPQVTYADKIRLDGFLAEYKSRGKRHGPIIIARPLGAQNENGVRAIADFAQRQAYDFGVVDIAFSDYDSGGDVSAPLVLAFTAYEAVAPECPSISDINLARSQANDPHRGFGCFMQANLAAMIADPTDLREARAEDSTDNARRSRVIDLYREGQSTATERGDDESGAISSAIN